ncbi:MAG: hypothetical protein HN922_07730 [Anaerolineae bacterium]|jgi:hypothetical protein|nr:hypothetical protein [Anaerolineae bacterium]
MKLSTRELVTVAVFGTLWGIVEISIGSVLKSLNIPFSGIILATMGLIIALVGRVFVPKKGSTIFIGIVAVLLKLFSLGGVILGPMIGIVTEALVAEIILTISGKPRRFSFILTGALGVTWVLVQPFFTGPLFFGRSFFVIWLDLLDTGNRLFSLKADAALWIVAALLASHLFVGGVVGWLGWDIADQLRLRLGRAKIEDIEIIESKLNEDL